MHFVCVNIYLVGGLEHVLFSIYWVDVVTGADDKILCQIVVCLWGKAHMGSAYDFNLLMYFLALRIGTHTMLNCHILVCLPTILSKMKVVAIVYFSSRGV